MLAMQHLVRFRPLASDDVTGEATLDTSTGLAWQSCPETSARPWREALTFAGCGAWRLPTAAELMCLFTTLPEAHPFPRLEPGAVYWSSSESPFAPASHVRGVVCERRGHFAIVLLEKSGQARRWLVRVPRAASRSLRGPGGSGEPS